MYSWKVTTTKLLTTINNKPLKVNPNICWYCYSTHKNMTGKELHYVKLPQPKKHRCATIHVKCVSSEIKFLYRPYQLCWCMKQKVTCFWRLLAINFLRYSVLHNYNNDNYIVVLSQLGHRVLWHTNNQVESN